MSVLQWVGTIVVSGGVSWFVAWYQLRKHEDIETKKYHLNQIKREIIEPLLDALDSGNITCIENQLLVTTYSIHGKSSVCNIPCSFLKKVETYHFPELSVLDDYLNLRQKLDGIKERLKPIVRETISNVLRAVSQRQGFQSCTIDSNFGLAVEKAVYEFLSSNLHRLDEWDWQRDFKGSFRASLSSKILEIQFNQYTIYKEHAPPGTTPENWALPVEVLLSSIIEQLINSESVRNLANELTELEQRCSEKQNELRTVLERIKYVQKLPLRKRRWVIFREQSLENPVLV